MKAGLFAIERQAKKPYDNNANNNQRSGGPQKTATPYQGKPRTNTQQGRPMPPPIEYTRCKACGNKPEYHRGAKCILGNKAQNLRPDCIFRKAGHPDVNLGLGGIRAGPRLQTFKSSEVFNPRRMKNKPSQNAFN